MDRQLGRLFERIRADAALRDNTIFVICSDNGPEPGAGSAGPFRGNKSQLYEGGIRTPLIIRYPGRLASRVISVPVVLGDLCPTICALAKVPAPSPLDFQDLSTLLFDSKPPASAKPRALFWHQPHYMNQGGKPGGVVREGDWKLIEQYEDGSLELFNIAKDPSEITDLAAAEPARVAAMRGMLEKWRRGVGAEPVKANPNFSRALWENCFVKTDASRLEALPTSEAMRPMLTDWRTAMNNVKVEGPNALIFLESRDAMVKATTLKYEDEPEKDTLGFWINAEDTASWTFQAPKAGEYRVTVLQGCGKGEGGSVVALDTTQGTCEFTVEDTGHFQRFIPCEVGKLRLVAGENTLTVRPVKLAKTAVMDLRRVILEGVE
jgi:hypothetical protein